MNCILVAGARGMGCEDVGIMLFNGCLHQPVAHLLLEEPLFPSEFSSNHLREPLELGHVLKVIVVLVEWLGFGGGL